MKQISPLYGQPVNPKRPLWRHLRSLLCLLFVVSMLLTTMRPAAAHSDKVLGPDGNVHDPIEITMSADRTPRPGEVVNLTLTTTPYLNAPALSITWVLPAGVELLNGPATETFAPFTRGQALTIQRQVRFPAAGLYKIAASATINPNAAQQYAYADVLYFTVADDGSSRITAYDPTEKSPLGSIMQSDLHVIEQSVNAAGTNDDDPCFTISGRIQRIERTPTISGFQADTLVPVRFARIEIREEDLIADDVEAHGITDANGNYAFSFCDNDGLFDDTLELYVRLYASIYESKDGFEIVYVEDSSYIDEMYYYDSNVFSSGGGTFQLNMDLNELQSGPMNIADTIYEAWVFWNESGGESGGVDKFDLTAEVHWEPGYVDLGSLNTFYDQAQEEITIGTVKDPDTWDDSSIIHEYGHMIEDNYSCDESFGGSHSFFQILDDEEFAWSEGYQNYFQGAVRQALGRPNASFYIDINAAGAVGATNLENWHTAQPMFVSPKNEVAIAALFWDLLDGADDGTTDGQDRVQLGHAMIQEVYTDYEFADQGIGDQTCSVDRYFQAWQALGKPANAATAAVVTQNVGGDSPFTVVSAGVPAESVVAAQGTAANAVASALDYQWWKHLIFTVDRSQSMAGTKLDAVKSVLNEQIADIANSPKGVEFSLNSFDNSALNNTTLLAGRFYADDVTPVINSLTAAGAADGLCPVESIRAMTQAIGDKYKGEAWLFTDGDAPGNALINPLVKSLQTHKLQQSIALLGGCNAAPLKPLNTSGTTQNYLGLAADASQPAGIVPYLLTALGSGGQFLYVGENQMNDAAEILRAQLSHSAGAGRWSDYVSDTPTYRYDKLPSWEYKWVDTTVANGGTNHGILFAGLPIAITLPQPFTYYGVTGQSTVQVDHYGYLTFGAPQSSQSQNTALPNAAIPNNALYPLWDELDWNNPPAVVAAQNEVGAASVAIPQVNVYSKADGEWFAIETRGFRTNAPERSYQVLLNATTGEIRYQYGNVGSDAGTATIGLENSIGTAAVQVSLNDVGGASDNMGYAFTPAPAQPSKSYTVPVDSLMTSVGFLLTGYSGSFDPLAVRTPGNAAVNCADSANVLCLNLGLVQYVQVKVNGRTGIWQATVSAGGTGAGTFSFSTVGAGSMNPTSNSDRNRSTAAQRFALQMERPVTGNVLDGWFTKPNGSAFGSAFRFYDDGAHDDGQAGDGRFGSDAFTPPSAGVAHFWLKGTVDGVAFTRSEATPFDFQPLEVTSQGDGINMGDVTVLSFTIQNLDDVPHCYDRSAIVPTGWLYDWKMTPAEFLTGLCINAGESATRTIEIKMDATTPNALPSGTTGEVIVTFIEKEVGQTSDSATALVTRRRPPALVEFKNHQGPNYLRPTGVDTVTLSVYVFDEMLTSVADGTEVTFSSSLGTIAPSGLTTKGRVYPVLTAGTVEGTALITAMAGTAVATTTVPIHAPHADLIELTSSAITLTVGTNNATLTATVRDLWGNPLPNQTVRLSVAGDGDNGTVDGSEVITGTTNAAGQVVANFARGATAGTVITLAELVVVEDGQPHVALEDQVALVLLEEEVVNTNRIFLPLVTR